MSARNILLIVFLIAFCSCSTPQRLEKNVAKISNKLIGNWSIRKTVDYESFKGQHKQFGLNTGIIYFYDNNTFMYKSRHTRQTGTWEIVVDNGYWGWQYDAHHGNSAQVYNRENYFLKISGNGFGIHHIDFSEAVVVKKSKVVIRYHNNDVKAKNILKRTKRRV